MEPGTVIGDRFEIERRVAAGGMGVVFAAIDRSTNQRVAVLERFMREANTLSRLSHPDIVQYIAHANIGYSLMTLGDLDGAETALRDGLVSAGRIGLRRIEGMVRHNLGLLLARRGRLEEAERVDREAMLSLEAQGDRRLGSFSRAYLAAILLESKRPQEALDCARETYARAEKFPGALAYALTIASAAQLELGDVPAALRDITRAHDTIEAAGGSEDGDALMRWVHALVLEAGGDRAAAYACIMDAKRRLNDRQAKLPNEDARALHRGCPRTRGHRGDGGPARTCCLKRDRLAWCAPSPSSLRSPRTLTHVGCLDRRACVGFGKPHTQRRVPLLISGSDRESFEDHGRGSSLESLPHRLERAAYLALALAATPPVLADRGPQLAVEQRDRGIIERQIVDHLSAVIECNSKAGMASRRLGGMESSRRVS